MGEGLTGIERVFPESPNEIHEVAWNHERSVFRSLRGASDVDDVGSVGADAEPSRRRIDFLSAGARHVLLLFLFFLCTLWKVKSNSNLVRRPG